MKAKQIFFTLLCLVLFAGTGSSQPTTQIQQDRERYERSLRFYWDGGRGGYWDGGGRGAGANARTQELLRDPEFRAALGVSDEYYRAILSGERNSVERVADIPEYREAKREREAAVRVVLGLGPLDTIPPTPFANFHNLNEEQLKAFNKSTEIDARIRTMEREFLDRTQKREDATFEDAITPELRQKIQEAHLAALGEMPMISPNVFEVLNLTDAQRQQMDRIKKELESEFEKHLGIYANNMSMILARIEAAIPLKNPQEDLTTFMRNLEAEPEHRRLLVESYTSSKSLAAQFRTRMIDILDADQRKRLQELIDNPPPHARYLIQRLRREHWAKHEEQEKGISKRADGDTDLWAPGPDSWKPGDPLPEWFRQEENTGRGFPRGD